MLDNNMVCQNCSRQLKAVKIITEFYFCLLKAFDKVNDDKNYNDSNEMMIIVIMTLQVSLLLI